MTQGRLGRTDELEELYRESPDLEPRRRESPRSEPPQGDELNNWCRRLQIAWLAVFVSIVLFEPAPSNPDAAIPLWGNVLLTAFTIAFVAGVVGLSLRRPWALRSSLVAGGLGVVIGAACAVTDHHVATWAAFELVAFSSLAVASLIGWRATA